MSLGSKSAGHVTAKANLLWHKQKKQLHWQIFLLGLTLLMKYTNTPSL